jgi:sucrose-6F-phosphate phosphohydrolase
MECLALLVSDLDGTLLGDEVALDQFRNWFRPLRNRFRLVYSSGRFIESVRSSIQENALPEPDAIICGVGTAIYDVRGRLRVSDWPRLTGQWDIDAIQDACKPFKQLQLQPAEFLSAHKISFYAADLDSRFLSELAERLTESGVNVSIVYSSNRDLDVLPAGVDKGAAAAYLADHWEIPKSRTIVAGDSGNDASMICCGFCGIVVANAQPELRQLRGENIYQAESQHAAGVREGLEYWQNQWGTKSYNRSTDVRSTCRS